MVHQMLHFFIKQIYPLESFSIRTAVLCSQDYSPTPMGLQSYLIRIERGLA